MKPEKEIVLAEFESFGAAYVLTEELIDRLIGQGFGRAEVVQAINELIANDSLWLNDRTLTLCRPETRDQLLQQWQLAANAYAWHNIALTVDRPDLQGFANNKYTTTLNQFFEKGGTHRVGVDVFKTTGPVLYLSDGQEVQYDAGRLLIDAMVDEMHAAVG